MPADGLASTLELWTLYRELAGHGPVTSDAGLGAEAQACALIQDATGVLSHYPATADACYTAAGAAGSAASNIASTAAVEALDLYMSDPGNETTLGHRRWMLANGLAVVGIGSTSSTSCHHVQGGGGGTSREWTAWPPAGPVPFGVWDATYSNLDDNGWSIQSDSLDVGQATVTVTLDDGTVLPMTVSPLLAHYGSTHAISMVPNGWRTEAGRAYNVELAGLGSPIAYTVEPVDCALR